MELTVNLDELIDCLECIQDANADNTVRATIDEVISVVYELAK